MSWFSTLPSAAQATVVAAAVSAVVASVVPVIAPFFQRPLERLRSKLLGDVEQLKAKLADEQAVRSARRSYEFDARKRLYENVEPLLFQLYEAAEGSYYRVASVVRSQRDGYLGPSAVPPGRLTNPHSYFFNSTIYFLFLPLAIYRLIQRSTTFVDLELDDAIRTKYLLLKLAGWAFTDDFIFAKQAPPLLPYDPNVPEWKTLREEKPATHWRQGLVVGHLDRLIDALIVSDDKGRRPITYGEFEDKALNDTAFQAALEPIRDILLRFSFPERPVLARILISHGCLMRLLLFTYSRPANIDQLISALDAFLASQRAQEDLVWQSGEDETRFSAIRNYLVDHLRWMSPQHYAVDMPADARAAKS